MASKVKKGNFKSSKTKAVKCLICGKRGMDFSLTNGSAVHRVCVDDLTNLLTGVDPELQKAKNSHQSHVNELKKLKAEESSFFGFLAGVFGDRNFSAEVAQLQRVLEVSQVKIDKIKAKNELSPQDRKKKLSLQKKIWDFWPDYPPDWDDRREELISSLGGKCQKCMGTNILQAHHKVPFWKGGSNKLENLELLCITCHGHEHGRDFERDGFDRKHTVVSDKEELISAAIKNKSKITFMYKKIDESRGSRRTIRPKEFRDFKRTRCVGGRCDLRKADRWFAIRRMYKVEISN